MPLVKEKENLYAKSRELTCFSVNAANNSLLGGGGGNEYIVLINVFTGQLILDIYRS